MKTQSTFSFGETASVDVFPSMYERDRQEVVFIERGGNRVVLSMTDECAKKLRSALEKIK